MGQVKKSRSTPRQCDKESRANGWRDRSWWIVIVVIASLAFAAVALQQSRPSFLQRSNASPLVSENTETPRPDRWGELRCRDIELTAPEVCTLIQCRTNLPQWFFSLGSREELAAFLSAAGCTTAQVSELAATAAPFENGWRALPGVDLIFSLSQETRARIYFRLAESPNNPDHVYAVRWTGPEFARWMAISKVSPATSNLIQQLVYSHGQHVMFADEAALNCRLSDEAEKIKVIEALLRCKALLVTLHVAADADVAALSRYWGAGGRLRDVQPVIAAVARLPGGGDVDIAHLLPPLPQSRLYTYPADGEPLYDCHWSAFNFFSQVPDNSLLQPGRVQQAFQQRYEPVKPGELRFGDLVLFVNQSGQTVHTAVYIADDIVFTKNGCSPKKPWILMRISDVQNIFWQMPSIGYARLKG